MLTISDSVNWPGRGLARRLSPRGMSDYARDHSRAVYETLDGFTLYVKYNGGLVEWKAQYKRHTTGWKGSSEAAITGLEKMLHPEVVTQVLDALKPGVLSR